MVLEVVNPAVYNLVGASVANAYVVSPFGGASYGVDLVNLYLASPVALLANGIQVADAFIGSPSAGEFTGINAYNAYVGMRASARVRAPPGRAVCLRRGRALRPWLPNPVALQALRRSSRRRATTRPLRRTSSSDCRHVVLERHH